MPPDPFATLELQTDASDGEVKAAYRRLAALYHPDRNPGFQAAANERLKQLNAAYASIVDARRQGAGTADPHAAATGADPSGTYRNGGRGRRDDVRGAARARTRQDPPADESAYESAYEASVAATLVRLGFLTRAAAPDSIVVRALASLLPPGSQIVMCLTYSQVKSSGEYAFREVGDRLLRPLPRVAEGGFGQWAEGSALALKPTTVVVCTKDALLWTSSQFASGDGVIVEERVTARSVRFAAVAGVVARKRGVVEVWLVGGVTLKIRTAAADATVLLECIKRASADP
jgi:hypothetical protein